MADRRPGRPKHKTVMTGKFAETLLDMKGNVYRTISFEREAYANERKDEYLRGRRHYAWIRYMKNK